MAKAETLEDLNVTQEELSKLTDAFKNEEFKKLFFEYAEEISNPENRARYEDEIRQLENEKGMDVKFVNPDPGYVIKTTIGGNKKAFINVCKNEHIGRPSSTKKIGKDGRPGLSWTLPHSFAPPREDIDKVQTKCQVFDFVVHPDTFRLAETNGRFKQMLNDLALDGIRKQFDVEPDIKNLRFPKMKYKGVPTATVIRTRLPDDVANKASKSSDNDDIMNKFPYPYDSMTSEEKAKQREKEYKDKKAKKDSKTTSLKKQQPETSDSDKYAVPKYTITHRSEVDLQDFVNLPSIRRSGGRPKALVININLPLLSSAAPIQLDIFEKQLKLVSDKPAKYRLDLALPYPVDENLGSAAFDKVHRKLVVTLPVLPVLDSNEPLCDQDDSSRGSVLSGFGSEILENGKSDATTKPLIEVISSSETSECDAAPSNETSDVAPSCDVAVDAISEITPAVDQLSSMVPTSAKFEIAYVLPDVECYQDVETLTFQFYVCRIQRDQLTVTFQSSSSFHVEMVSVGDGGFPVHYRCCVQLDTGCNVVPRDYNVTVTDDKVLLRVLKDIEACGTVWENYLIGSQPSQLQMREFIDASFDTRVSAVDSAVKSDAATCKDKKLLRNDSDDDDLDDDDDYDVRVASDNQSTNASERTSNSVDHTTAYSHNTVTLAADSPVVGADPPAPVSPSEVDPSQHLVTPATSECSLQDEESVELVPAVQVEPTFGCDSEHRVDGRLRDLTAEATESCGQQQESTAERQIVAKVTSPTDLSHLHGEVTDSVNQSLVESPADNQSLVESPADSHVESSSLPPDSSVSDHSSPADTNVDAGDTNDSLPKPLATETTGEPVAKAKDNGADGDVSSNQDNDNKTIISVSNGDSSRPETVLNWAEPTPSGATAAKKCVVDFTNNVMFDLDVE